MRAVATFLQVLVWAVAAWFFVGLIGATRWLAPGAELSPEALAALGIKLVALAVLIAAGVLLLRATVPPERDTLA